MPKPYPLSDIQKKQAIRFYQKGFSLEEVSIIFHCSMTTIWCLLRKQGIKTRPTGVTNGTLKLTEDIKKELLEKVGRQSQPDIARDLGVSHNTVYKWLKQLNALPGLRKGETHPGYIRGSKINKNGYRFVPLPDDPRFISMKSGPHKIVLEHRIVMALSLGRPLSRHETVHHINGDRKDNRIENLQLQQGKHGNGIRYKCAHCGSHDIIPVEF